MEAQGSVFDLLLGRRTYDLWTGYWPKAGDTPIANIINAATKYIATHVPDSLEWGPVGDLAEDIIEGIRNVKLIAGQDVIVWGKFNVDIPTSRSGTGRRGGSDRLASAFGPW